MNYFTLRILIIWQIDFDNLGKYKYLKLESRTI